jgi:FkbM family methyltransferase
MASTSQFGQDRHIIDNIYKGLTNGYFIEVGASDGINCSNTYILEKLYNWKGICVECNPEFISRLYMQRSALIFTCAAWKENDKTLEFFNSPGNGGHAGLVCTNSHTHLLNTSKISVKTKTLTSILDDAKAPNFIHFLSIDTEGSEYDILNQHDFDKYKFGYICVEHNHIAKNREAIRSLLETKGYRFYRENSVDDDYILADLDKYIK